MVPHSNRSIHWQVQRNTMVNRLMVTKCSSLLYVACLSPCQYSVKLQSIAHYAVPGPTSTSNGHITLQCFMRFFPKLMLPCSGCSLNSADSKFCEKLIWTGILKFMENNLTCELIKLWQLLIACYTAENSKITSAPRLITKKKKL